MSSVDNLQQSIEAWITNIDSLSIYNLDRVLSPVSKLNLENITIENLFKLDSSDNESNLIVERDLTTGRIIDYHEAFNKEADEVVGEVDPELLSANELLNHLPSVFNGIDFTDRKLTDGGGKKPSRSEASVEVSIFSDLIDDKLNITDTEIHVEEEKKEREEERIDAIENADEFWSKQGLVKKSEISAQLLTGEKSRDYKWAVEVGLDLIPKYDKIRANLAYQWKFELDVFQKQAVYLMENSESVFVAAHTSAGKTVVAEYAIALAFKHKTKVIYTSPIKALSNQKFREFKTIFTDVGLITGDIQLAPEASCLIMTTEILRSMLYRRSETLRDLEWVIFDEVHYMNDASRGVVWEETLILLPEHINIVMLSATMPNHMDFAEWVGKIKQRNIYVMCTKKRPVPLEHYLYTGNSNKTSDELFLLVDANSRYQTIGYTKAVEAKKNRSKTANTNFGGKGTKQNATPQQDKNIWLSLIGMLQKKELLPTVAFVFSRKRCDDNIDLLASVDLNTQMEKSEVHMFIQKSIMTLSKEDRQIPQILHLSEALKRGLGVHHSGILPLMKEIIELLFQRGLVKILFATETFAMGINMPARSVVFDSMRKHDGLTFRSLNTSEYIQMAGRAGRRGLDTTGTVIILCKNEVMETTDLHSIMLGKATPLESKFRLTYSMILSLLRQKDMRIQDFMKRSFFEHKLKSADDPVLYENSIKYLNERKRLLMDEKNVNQHYLKCAYCASNITEYYATCSKHQEAKKDVYLNLEQVLAKRKVLIPGRIVLVKGYKAGTQAKLYPVLLLQELSESNEALVLSLDQISFDSEINRLQPTINYIYEKASKSVETFETVVETLKKFEEVNAELPCFKSCLAQFKDFTGSCLLTITYKNIEAITSKSLKLTSVNIKSILDTYTDVLYRHEQHSNTFVADLKAEMRSLNAFNSLTLELFNYTEGYMSEMNGDSDGPIGDLIDFIRDMNVRDIGFSELFDDYKTAQQKLSKFNCLQCPSFNEHFQQTKINCAIEDRISYINDVISGNTLLLVSEYRYRIEVLKKLRLIDDKNFVLLKGKVALEISVLELFLTELIVENLFSGMSSNEIVALLSSVVYQAKQQQDDLQTKKSFNNIQLDQGKERMVEIAIKLNRIQSDAEIQVMGTDDYMEQLNFGLVEVVYEWSKGIPFATIKQMTQEQEGVIVRTIQRLDETCSNLKDAAKIMGDTLLVSKMEHCSTLIRRDIVFAGSLYTKTETV